MTDALIERLRAKSRPHLDDGICGDMRGRTHPGHPECAEAAAAMERLRLIVSTIVPEAGVFDPENEEQIERIAMEWVTRFHAHKDRVRHLETALRRVVEIGAVDIMAALELAQNALEIQP